MREPYGELKIKNLELKIGQNTEGVLPQNVGEVLNLTDVEKVSKQLINNNLWKWKQ
jgi:hypothetical protein